MARPKGFRVWGPDKHGRKWRIRVQRPDGEIDLVVLDDETEAHEKAEALRRNNPAGWTVSQLAEKYVADVVRRGRRTSTVDNVKKFLRSFVNEVGGRLLSELDDDHGVRDVAAWYSRRASERKLKGSGDRAARSHQEELATVRRMFAFAVDEKVMETNPASGVKKIGRAKRGKADRQLTEGEAETLYGFALSHARDERAAATLLLLVQGMRAGETVVHLTVRDIDRTSHGSVLYCRGTKTENANRKLALAQEVATALEPHLQGKLLLAPLFAAHLTGDGNRRGWLRRAVKWTCKSAGVPFACPQALRGTWSSIAEGVAETPLAVSRALGHGNRKVTEQNYLRPGAAEDAKTARVARVLGGNWDGHDADTRTSDGKD